ncbi:BfmA/BtgA family mobilization protein [Gelidibacter japonicus]|jgi:hypothetical protein|uniref:BfmA/BtgA family mobilization protein n=1 Tax=Gelidibacter japonicus TaxID=1962232 RepID=UPI002AFFFFB0|nr:BfmA/BtgA family mobilization protein [Gelidibacter japonicus]
MDEEFENERFDTLKIKASVADRFRRFCRTMSKSQSMTMLSMIEYFEWNGLSPLDKKEQGLMGELIKNRKRTEAVIAIMKDIEKHQTKPTIAMIQALFTEVEPIKKPRLIEKTPEEFKAQFENKKTDL